MMLARHNRNCRTEKPYDSEFEDDTDQMQGFRSGSFAASGLAGRQRGSAPNNTVVNVAHTALVTSILVTDSPARQWCRSSFLLHDMQTRATRNSDPFDVRGE